MKLESQKNKAKIKDRQAEYYQKNKDRIAERKAEYYQKNKDRIAERKKVSGKIYYQKNKDRIKEYREKNKDKRIIYDEEYYQKNRDKKLQQAKVSGKIYYQKNKGKIEVREKKYREIKKKKTYSSDEAFLRNLVYMKKTRGKSLKQKYPLKIFNLTYEQVIDIYNKQERKCFYSGLPFVVEKNHPMSISIDRIDNNKGYTIDNIALCARAINLMKTNCSYKNLIPIFKATIKHYKNI